MSIRGVTGSSDILKIYDRQKVNETKQKTKVELGQDAVSFSQKSKEIAESYRVAMKALQHEPNIREDKVKAIEEKMSQGDMASNAEIVSSLIESLLNK